MQPDDRIANRYRIIRALGRGGMGTVWLCHDEVLDRQVAIKQINPGSDIDGQAVQRAEREARAIAAIDSPHVVRIHDVIREQDQTWLVMEYVEGQNLQQMIVPGPLQVAAVAHIGAQIASALEAAHALGIVHRDVKPANIVVTPDGTAKLLDFGISRSASEQQLTAVGMLSGTPVYFSPELARTGEPTAASDVWALGATLYTAVEGVAPYADAGTPIATLHRIANEPPRAAQRAGALAPVLASMMQPDTTARWTMRQSAAALGGLDEVGDATVVLEPGTPHTAGAPTRQLAPVAPTALARPKRRQPLLLALAAVLAVLAGVLVWWALAATSDGPTTPPADTTGETTAVSTQSDQPQTEETGSEESTSTEQPEKTDKPEKTQKPDKTEKPEKTEKPDKPDTTESPASTTAPSSPAQQTTTDPEPAQTSVSGQP